MNPKKATILMAEDSPVQAELLRRILEEAGYEALIAQDGAAALAKAKASRPDAVVTDINMPVMDGYALCRAMRQDADLKFTPIILLTMLTEPLDVIRGLNAGADAYVTKPYNAPTLLSRLESLLAYPPLPPPEVERRKVELRIAGETHLVDAHGPRMLNLLVSTYENAVVQNRDLVATQQALEDFNQHLEDKVREKTAALQASEQRFRGLIENASDLVAIIGERGEIRYISPSIKRLGGYECEEVLGRNYLEFTHPEDRDRAFDSLARVLAEPDQTQASEIRFRHKDGSWVTLESIARNALAESSISGIVVNARDITERKNAERSLARANRALRTLSAGNTALVHAVDEAALLAEMCRVIVAVGGYRVAVAAYARDDSRKSVEPMAFHGIDGSIVKSLQLSWGEDEFGGGAIGRAIRLGALQLVRHAESDPRQAPWREVLTAADVCSELALPVRLDSRRALGVLYIASSEPDAFDGEEVSLLAELASDLGFGVATLRTRAEHREAGERLRQSLEDSIQAIAATLERRDPYTAGHQRRVADLAAAIASELGLSEEHIHGVHLAGTIHDLGKIGAPAEILAKPSRLSDIEYSLIKEHPQAGYEILKDVAFPWPIARMVLEHHERLDGSGYPHGLKGEAILLGSRILAVADVVEAMSSHRPYRPGHGIEAALAEIEKGRDKAFDAAAVDACVKLFRERGFDFDTIAGSVWTERTTPDRSGSDA